METLADRARRVVERIAAEVARRERDPYSAVDEIVSWRA